MNPGHRPHAHREPLLWPAPARLRLTGGKVSNARLDAPTAVKLDGTMRIKPGGYRLRIAAPQSPQRGEAVVELVISGEAGLRAGRATLAQLAKQYGTSPPCLEIEDEPAFHARGVMLDVSRTRVPTMERLRADCGVLAGLKVNHLQLYTEHAFAYAGHEGVWEGASPITPEEARELSQVCRRLGIDLAPNQNCLGHLKRWLSLPRYAGLAETHGEWKFMSWLRRGPFSLCPVDEGSIELVRDLLGQLVPCFESRLVNIGCDEAYDIGQGRSAEAVAQRGKAAVYFEHVGKVVEAARGLGSRAMIWADIALSHPEELQRWPGDAIALAWGYEPDTDFAAWCRVLGERGIRAWVCPGTSSWRSITGRTTERLMNLARAAEARGGGGAEGMLITDWGDHGHHQHWPIAMNGLAQGTGFAWNPRGVVHRHDEAGGRRLDAAQSQAISLHALGDPSEELGLSAWLDELGDVDLPIREQAGAEGAPIRNSSALFLDLYRPEPYVDPVSAPVGAWHEVAERLGNVASRVPTGLGESPLVAREVAHTLASARLAAEQAIACRAGWQGETRARLIELAEWVRAEHAALWCERCRPGGLEESLAFFDGPMERLRAGSAGGLLAEQRQGAER